MRNTGIGVLVLALAIALFGAWAAGRGRDPSIPMGFAVGYAIAGLVMLAWSLVLGRRGDDER